LRGKQNPGSYGFNFNFIKSCREVVKVDILRELNEFHANRRLPKGTNSSFLALIPKRLDPQDLGEYRPISLIGCLYKIIAKLLARRINRVMNIIVDCRQTNFLGERNILDGALSADEVVHEAMGKKKPCLIFIVDFEKAYDIVRWELLVYMLQRLGFCKK